MRTNIEIDDALMSKAMKAGPYQTKKEAVEAGLRLLARQVTYREILKWEGRLKWEGDESIDWTQPAASDASAEALGPLPDDSERSTAPRKAGSAVVPTAAPPSAKKRRAGR